MTQNSKYDNQCLLCRGHHPNVYWTALIIRLLAGVHSSSAVLKPRSCCLERSLVPLFFPMTWPPSCSYRSRKNSFHVFCSINLKNLFPPLQNSIPLINWSLAASISLLLLFWRRFLFKLFLVLSSQRFYLIKVNISLVILSLPALENTFVITQS